MNDITRNVGFYLGAIGLHAAVLWGWSFSEPTLISEAGSEGDTVEVSLVGGIPGESASESASPEAPQSEPAKPDPAKPEPPQPEPAKPEPPQPEPPQPEPPKPEPPQPEPPQPEPPQPEPPKPEPPKPEPRKSRSEQVAPKPQPTKSGATSAKSGGGGNPGASASSQGGPGSGRGISGSGDNAHATWRNKVQPVYPEAARLARLTGRLEIEVRVNALGQPVFARVVKGSGSALLDDSALKAVRASTFNPRRLGSIPLPDTIIVPVTFRLNSD